MPQLYRSYHSQFKIQYGNGSLPDSVSGLVPRSTRQGWKEKNSFSFWNPIAADQEDKDLAVRSTAIYKLQEDNKSLRIQLKVAFQLMLLYRELLALMLVKNGHFKSLLI